MRGTLGALSLRAALLRGGVVVAANWPVILIQSIAVGLHRAALGVPIVAGVFVVAVLMGIDVGSLVTSDLRATAGLVAAALSDRPEALPPFVVAVGLVAFVGAVPVFLAQAGVAAVLSRGEAEAGPFHRGGLRRLAWEQARVFSLAGTMTGVRRFGRRFVRIGLTAYGGYALLGAGLLGGWVALLGATSSWVVAIRWPALLLLTAGVVGAAWLLRLVAAVLQGIVVVGDVGVLAALGRLPGFIADDGRRVGAVWLVLTGVTTLTLMVSLLLTAGLALVAWVPLVGIVVVPLQMAAWVARGVVFQYIDLAVWTAYQSHYRRHVDPTLAEPPAALFSEGA